MIEAGLTVAEAKARSPSCYACARKVHSRENTLEPLKQEESYAATNR
jgi:hypothetical protein